MNKGQEYLSLGNGELGQHLGQSWESTKGFLQICRILECLFFFKDIQLQALTLGRNSFQGCGCAILFPFLGSGKQSSLLWAGSGQALCPVSSERRAGCDSPGTAGQQWLHCRFFKFPTKGSPVWQV